MAKATTLPPPHGALPWRHRGGTLVYAPDVAVYVSTLRAGILDLSRDIVDFTTVRRVNAESNFSMTLANKYSKYDKVIGRMDRIVVFLKRFTWLQVFAGYVTTAPYETVVPGTVDIEATCTLKRLEHTFWDPYASENQVFFPGGGVVSDPTSMPDGGAAASAFKILTTVVGWDASQILVQKIPEAFLRQAAKLAAGARQDLDPAVLSGIQQLLDADGWSGQLDAAKTSGKGSTNTGNPPATGAKSQPATVQKQWSGKATFHTGAAGSVAYFTHAPDGTKLLVKNRDTRKVVMVTSSTAQAPETGTVIDMASGDFNKLGATNVTPSNLPNVIITWDELVLTPSGDPVFVKTPSSQPQAKWSSYAQPNGWNETYGPGAPQNGNVPIAAMAAVPGTSQYLRPDVEAAYEQMLAACRKTGKELKVVWAYRSTGVQTALWSHNSSNPNSVPPYQNTDQQNPGHDPHGSATAIDIDTKSTGFKWAINNAASYGFIRDAVGSNPGHFDFMDATSPGFAAPTGVGAALTGAAVAGPGGTAATSTQTAPFNVMFFYPGLNAESDVFTGDRAWINDVPVLQTIQYLVAAGMRDFQSAPNGDFLMFYPDKFGIYGKLPVLEVHDIEIINFKLQISDDQLTTHVAVAGDFQLAEPHTGIDLEWVLTSGLISVQQDQLMKLLFKLDPKKDYEYLGSWILNRFGIRPLRQEISFIRDHNWEFMLALHLFMQKWTEQFLTQVQFTFLPEMYPGMRVVLADRRPQIAFYVEQVLHQGSRQAGFTTTAQVSSPMIADGHGGWKLMPLEQAPVPLPQDQQELLVPAVGTGRRNE